MNKPRNKKKPMFSNAETFEKAFAKKAPTKPVKKHVKGEQNVAASDAFMGIFGLKREEPKKGSFQEALIGLHAWAKRQLKLSDH